MSTYSSLKFELILTGDQSGQWGNTTNTNIGTAINEAIAGSVDITFASADLTLTLVDSNVTQSARNVRLNLTGTSGGVRILTLGSGCQISKPYIVNNGLADAVTVKNTSGTGISVPAGKTMWLFNNGTNVVDVVSHLSSLTLVTALPATSGGSGQSSYAVGDLLYASTTTALSKLAAGTAGQLLQANGAATAPTWVTKNSFSTDITVNGLTVGRGTGNDTGSTAFGRDVLLNQLSTSYNNTAIGDAAGKTLVNGGSNVFVGQAAGYTVSGNFGFHNTFVGTESGGYTANAGQNTAVGYQSLYNNSTGIMNVALGYLAGSNSRTDENVYVGARAGENIGTLADYNVMIGYQSGTSASGDSSVGVGHSTLTADGGGQNVAVGFEALKVVTGGTNTAVGYKAGRSCLGTYYNVAVGHQSLFSATGSGGQGNTAVGADAGYSMTTASYSTYIGRSAGLNQRGSNNVAVGYGAGGGGYSLPTTYFGSFNTSVGVDTLYKLQTGQYNVAVGYAALTTLTTSTNNTAVGKEALTAFNDTVTVDTRNTSLGYSAGSSLISGSNNTLLGNSAQASTTSASNEFVLGNSSVSVLRCQQSSISGLSDARDKYDIEDLPVGLDFINSLKARRFKWDKRDDYFDEVASESGPSARVAVPKNGSRKSDEWNEGFIAQEVDEASIAAGADWMRIVHKANPERLEMAPGKLIPVLVKAIQELTARLEALEARN
jgi:hypothetical protein